MASPLFCPPPAALAAAAALTASVAASAPAFADTTVLTFDNVPEGTITTNQYNGVVITGASVLTENSQLNSAYPPVSDPNVIYDYLNGIITFDFTTNVSSVGAYVTGELPVSESIYDGATLLGTVSTPGANEIGATTGYSPNDFLSLSSTSNITSVVFDNGTNGTQSDTFTLDNVTIEGGAITVSGAPEPGLDAHDRRYRHDRHGLPSSQAPSRLQVRQRDLIRGDSRRCERPGREGARAVFRREANRPRSGRSVATPS